MYILYMYVVCMYLYVHVQIYNSYVCSVVWLLCAYIVTTSSLLKLRSMFLLPNGVCVCENEVVYVLY